jgi:chemotaxis protein methyltransferase CheR
MFEASKFKFNFKDKANNNPSQPESKKVLNKNKIELDDEKFIKFRDFIYGKSGIYFNDSKKYLLESRLAKRVSALNLAGFDEYFYFIRFDKGKNDELIQLYDSITINETSFFRHEPQIYAFANEVLPKIFESKVASGQKSIKVWSAASSSGEEPYTLAMLYHQNLKDKYPDIKFEIYGSDLSEEVLAEARKGVYNDYAIRNVPEDYMAKYFIKENGKFILDDNIKSLVTFSSANLIDETDMNQFKGIDIIFCRNVLIYFDEASKSKVVSKLYNNLLSGGYLFIGHSESLHGISKAFKLVHFNKAIAYKKE